MARHTPDDYDLSLSSDRESRLETRWAKDAGRERVAPRRVVTNEDRAEMLALNFRSAFVKPANDDHSDYDTLAEREMDVRS